MHEMGQNITTSIQVCIVRSTDPTDSTVPPTSHPNCPPVASVCPETVLLPRQLISSYIHIIILWKIFRTNNFWFNSQKVYFDQKMSIRWLLAKHVVCQSVFPKL